MAAGAGTIEIEVPAQAVLTSLQLKVIVKGKRRALRRVKIAAQLCALAARVLGGKVELEAELR